MQNACEEVVISLGRLMLIMAASLSSSLKRANDALACVVLQRVKGFVDHHPARLAEEDA